MLRAGPPSAGENQKTPAAAKPHRNDSISLGGPDLDPLTRPEPTKTLAKPGARCPSIRKGRSALRRSTRCVDRYEVDSYGGHWTTTLRLYMLIPH